MKEFIIRHEIAVIWIACAIITLAFARIGFPL